MSVSLLGVGFSFGAKDKGLKSKQRQVAAGFGNIADEVEKMGKKAQGSSEPMAAVADQMSGSAMDKLTASVNTLAMAMSKNLPNATKKGAEAMDQGSGKISVSEGKISEGMGFIREAVEKLHDILRVNRLQAFLQAVSLSRLGDIAHGVENIASNGMNLTTSFEETIIAAQKTSRALGANFGIGGKQLSRFSNEATSMSIALNIGADKAAESIYQVTLATKELAAVGIKSGADLAKFSDVSGVSASELTQIFKQAGQQFHMTDDQLKQLAGSALESGKQIGDIGGQFKMMPHIMELISRRAAVLGKKLDPKQMAEFASQTLAVSGAFYNMGASTEDAREMAVAMATQLVESGEKFANLFSGTGQDISDFHMALGIATGDIQKSFATMTQGPGEFMSGLADMVIKSKKSGQYTAESMNLLRGQLEKTFGSKQAAMMVNFFDQADEKQLSLIKTTTKAKGNLGEFAKEGFSTGRSLAQSFELMKDQFVTSFRNIGRSAAVDFVDKTGKEFKRFNAQMLALVKEGGPLGELVAKFSEIHQIGALALIPGTLRPLAAVFGTIVKEAAPMIGVLGSLGFRLNMLASPFTMITGAVVGLGLWFLKLRMESKSTKEAFQKLTEGIKTGVAKALIAAKEIWKWITETAIPVIEDFGTSLWAGLISGVDKGGKTAASEIGSYLGSVLRKAFDYVYSAAKSYLLSWWGKMTNIWSDGSTSFLDKIKQTLGNSVGMIFAVFAVAKFTPILGILGTFAKVITGVVVPAISTLIYVIANPVALLMAAAIAAAAFGAAFLIWPDKAASAIDSLGKSLGLTHDTIMNIRAAGYAAGETLKFIGQVLLTLKDIVVGVAKVALFMNEIFSKAIFGVGKFFKELVFGSGESWNMFDQRTNQSMDNITTAVEKARLDQKQIRIKAYQDLQAAQIKTAAAMDAAQTQVVQAATGTTLTVQQKGSTAIVYLHTVAEQTMMATKGVSDQVAKAINSNIQIVDAQARGAARAIGILPKFDRASDDASKLLADWRAVNKQLWDLSKQNSFYVKDEEDYLEKQSQLANQIRTTYGVAAGVLDGLNQKQQKFFATADELVKHQSITETKAYQERLDAAFERYKDERIQIEKNMQIGAMSAADGAKRAAEADAQLDRQKMIIEQGIASVQKNWTTAVIMAKGSQQEMLSIAAAASERFEAEALKRIGVVDFSIRESVQQTQHALAQSYFAHLQSVVENSKLSDAQRQVELAKVQDDYTKQLDAFSGTVKQMQDSVAASGGKTSEQAKQSLDELRQRSTVVAKSMSDQTAAAVGSMKRELGLTAEEAANNLKDIAAIDPKKFSADLKIIKQVYIDFTKTAQDEAQKMLIVTGKAFEDFNKQAIDHWTKQKQNVSMMEFNDDDIKKLTEAVGRTVDKAFAGLTDMITARVEDSVTKAFTNAFTKVIVQAKKFVKDSMDIFGDLTKQMVAKFGEAWAKILDFTFSAIQAIEKDSARAIANLQRIDMAMRGTVSAQSQIAGAGVKQDVKMTIGKTELENIFQATHHPEWYENDFKFRAMEIIQALNALATALLAAPRNTQTTQVVPASRSAANSIRIGIGTNRATVLANGSQQ